MTEKTRESIFLADCANRVSGAIDDPNTWMVCVTVNNSGRLLTQYLVWSTASDGQAIEGSIGQTLRVVLRAVRAYRPERLCTAIFVKHPERHDHITGLAVMDGRELVKAVEFDYVAMPNPEDEEFRFVMFSEEEPLDVKETIDNYQLGKLLVPKPEEDETL